MTGLRASLCKAAAAFGLTGGIFAALAGDGFAAPALPQSSAVAVEGASILENVALKKKKRRQHILRKKGQHGPVRPSQDSAGGPKKKNNKPRSTKINVRKPPLLCIDGKLFGRSCRCVDKSTPKRMAALAFRCLPPIVTEAGAKANIPSPEIAKGTSNETQQAAVNASVAGEDFIADEILVSVALSALPSLEADIVQRYGLQPLGSWTLGLVQLRVIRFRIVDGRTVNSVEAAMADDNTIITRQPNYLYRHQGAAGGPTALQYALDKLAIPSASKLFQGQGVKIAILDTGIDGESAELAGTIAATFKADGGAIPVSDPHGTEIAGIIAARGHLQGVARGVKLLDAAIFDYRSKTGENLASTTALLRGLDWAAAQKGHIINLSLTGPADPLIAAGMKALAHRGIVVVAAAGNGGAGAPASFPAAYDEVIAATATDIADQLYGAATRGNYVDVAAPGVDILSPSLEGSYSMVSGTSFAAAHVSGVVALLLGQSPNMKPADVKARLEATSVDLGRAGVDPDFGAGLINALKALRQ